MRNERPPSRPPIVFVGFDGVAAIDIAGPIQAFALANAASNPDRRYDARLISLEGKQFRSESGVIFRSDGRLDEADAVDTIIIPGGEGALTEKTIEAIATWLVSSGGPVRRVAAIAAGVFSLAHTGFLDGKRATTHWRLRPALRRRFPRVELDESSTFVKDGRYYTAATGTASVQLALDLIQQDHGIRTALQVARELNISLKPPGGTDAPVDNYGQIGADDRLAELPSWIVAHLDRNLSVNVLAERACLCPRHFRRLFKKTFNATPAEFVEQLRIAEAKRRLISHHSTIEAIATSVGYKTAEAFRQSFERRVGVAPTKFRRARRQDPGRAINGVAAVSVYA